MLEFRIPKLAIEEMLKKRWCLACYLVINWKIRELVEHVNVAIPTEVYTELANHVYAYVNEDKMPPKEIAPVVLNMAEEMMTGKSVKIRAGDYIAIQNFMRSKG
jgi:hypothetical protein